MLFTVFVCSAVLQVLPRAVKEAGKRQTSGAAPAMEPASARGEQSVHLYIGLECVCCYILYM